LAFSKWLTLLRPTREDQEEVLADVVVIVEVPDLAVIAEDPDPAVIDPEGKVRVVPGEREVKVVAPPGERAVVPLAGMARRRMVRNPGFLPPSSAVS